MPRIRAYAGLFRGGIDLLAVHGQERLVRGHHVFLVPDRLEDELFGRLVPADEFDHDVDVRIGQDILRIGRKLDTFERNAPITFDIQIGYLLERYRRAKPSPDDFSILDENAGRASSYRAEADDTYID